MESSSDNTDVRRAPWTAAPASSQGEARLLAAAAVWRTMTPASLRLIRDALGDRVAPLDWKGFCALALASGIAEHRNTHELTIVDSVQTGSAFSPAAEDTTRMLLAHWLRHPEPRFVADAVGWCIQLGAWRELSRLWTDHLLVSGTSAAPDIAGLLAGLPAEARREAPLLSLAWAQARSQAVGGPAGDRRLIRDLMSDGLSFHSRWRDAKETDTSLLAAAVWMTLQRAMPSSDPVSSLDLAWETQREAAAMLEWRRAECSGLQARVEAVFRAASAHVAFARADMERAVIQADHAAMLDPFAAAWIAGGVGALARELAGGVADGPSLRKQLVPGLDSRAGLLSANAVAATLARAVGSLRKLDRASCAEALEALSDLPPGTTMWTAVVSFEALCAALWGDPEAGLTRFDTARTAHSMVSVEHLEPMGGALLVRARIALLDRLGASAAARAAARGLAAPWRSLQEARSLLWAGDYAAARSVADAALYDADTWSGDRLSLRAVRAGAQLMDPSVSEEASADAVVEIVTDCLRHALVPLAMLPGDLRGDMVASYRAHVRGPVPTAEAMLLARLQGVASRAGMTTSPVSLTRRERLLLPMLATADAVPDIAASLHVSPNTVRTQVAHLRRKFGVKSRAELVRVARNAGLL